MMIKNPFHNMFWSSKRCVNWRSETARRWLAQVSTLFFPCGSLEYFNLEAHLFVFVLIVACSVICEELRLYFDEPGKTHKAQFLNILLAIENQHFNPFPRPFQYIFYFHCNSNVALSPLPALELHFLQTNRYFSSLFPPSFTMSVSAGVKYFR